VRWVIFAIIMVPIAWVVIMCTLSHVAYKRSRGDDR